MKISEVIKRLQEIQEKHGDLFVRVETKDYNVPFERMNLVVHGHYSLYIK